MGTLATVTLNPALDVSTAVDTVVADHKMRCEVALREPGGGGINVARVADRLGTNARPIVVAGGPTGAELVALIAGEGLDPLAVSATGSTRQSFSVTETGTDRQFRFVLPGPPVDAAVVAAVVESVAGCQPLGVLVVSGSVPAGSPEATVAAVVEAALDRDEPPRVIVDTSGPELIRALQTEADVVKPSARELASVVGRGLVTEADVRSAADEVMARSRVAALLVSVGPGGALLVERDGRCHRLRPPAVRVASAVGAGDSLVGGLAAGLCRGDSLLDAARLGVAAGTAAVISAGTALCSPDDVDVILPQVIVEVAA